MSKQAETVVKRDEYKVGMRVRLRNGDSYEVIGDAEDGSMINLSTFAGDHHEHGEYVCREFPELDIIGEVVTAAASKPARKAVTHTTTITRTFSDGMEITDGTIDGDFTIESAEEYVCYLRRGIARAKVVKAALDALK